MMASSYRRTSRGARPRLPHPDQGVLQPRARSYPNNRKRRYSPIVDICPDPGAARRRLAAELRRYRSELNLSAEDVARALNWSRGKLFRMNPAVTMAPCQGLLPTPG